MRSDTGGRGERAEVPHVFPPARVPWSVGEGLVLLLVFVLAHWGFASLSALAGPASGALPVRAAGANAAILCAIYLFLRRRAGSPGEVGRLIGLRVRRPLRSLVRALGPLGVGLIALFAWGLLQGFVMRQTGWEPTEQEVVRRIRTLVRAGEAGQVACMVFLGVVLAPMVEEVVFRVLLYLPLRNRFSPLRAALLVSAVFALLHASPSGFGHLFVLALVLTWMMESAGTLLAPLLAHGVHNGVMLAVLLIFA